MNLLNQPIVRKPTSHVAFVTSPRGVFFYRQSPNQTLRELIESAKSKHKHDASQKIRVSKSLV